MKNLDAIKKAVAGKMQAKVGKCSVCGRNHDKGMHGSNKGYASLNPSRKSKDNMSMEGKDEQEKN